MRQASCKPGFFNRKVQMKRMIWAIFALTCTAGWLQGQDSSAKVTGRAWLTLTAPVLGQLGQYALSPVERLGCLIGIVKPTGEIVVSSVQDLAPGPGSTTTVVTTHGNCPADTVGRVHSHPNATNCWYYFPRTNVPATDGVMFMRSGYMMDAIVCGTQLVWVARDGGGQRVTLLSDGN